MTDDLVKRLRAEMQEYIRSRSDTELLAEFTSEKNCMVALDAVKSNGRWATFVYATCVQK